MKILLIDNHTDYLFNVTRELAGHELEVQKYQPGLDFHWQDKDLIVLSGGGGEGYEVKDERNGRLWYEDEMNFVLVCQKPIVGICMGFEVISSAFGAAVKPTKLIKGFKTHQTSAAGRKHLSRANLKQFEYHEFAVPSVSSKHFEVLAESDTGVEMIKHKTRKIVATQFHPEVVGGTLGLQESISTLLSTI